VYLEPKEYKVDFEPKKVEAHLGNLFNGNTVLGELTIRAFQYRLKEFPDTDNASLFQGKS
jgi:hypothetical protein